MPDPNPYVEYPPAVLRVDPSAIPTVREALDRTLNELHPHIQRMRDDAYILDPWLGDRASEEMRVAYNSQVMDAGDGPYQAMVTYTERLQQARDQLAAIEADYRRTEGENSALWGRRA